MAAVERLVNLALFLAASPGPVTADRIRSEDIGYPESQDEQAFLRMFERDKDDLRSMGFVIHADDQGAYRLDKKATLAAAIDLTPSEVAAVRVAGAALLGDASFPFTDDLRLALTKVAGATSGERVAAVSRLADEDPECQGRTVATFSAAAANGKRVAFEYTNSRGTAAARTLEPYGLFLHDGRWYVVGRDVDKDAVRTYTVSRVANATPNSAKPKTPDFDKPDDFDVARFVRLPFQYGEPADEFVGCVRIDESSAWRIDTLAAGQGVVTSNEDGSLSWSVPVRSKERFLRWVLEQGPGLIVSEPSALRDSLRVALSHVEALHG